RAPLPLSRDLQPRLLPAPPGTSAREPLSLRPQPRAAPSSRQPMKHSLCEPRLPPTHRACHCESRAQTNLSEGAGPGLRRRSRALRLQEVIDEKLQPPLALIFVDVQPVDQMQRALRQGECRFAADLVEGNGIEGAAGPRGPQPQFAVSVPDPARAADGEHAIETRLGEGLSP